MKIKELISELQTRDTFKEFKKKHPESFFTAGFFILSNDEKEQDKIQMDYYITKEQKFCSFEYPFNSSKIHDDIIKNSKELKNLDFKADLLDLKEIIKEELKENYSKLICVLQNDMWNITCLSGMKIRRLKINPHTGEIISNNNLEMNDIMRFK